MSLRDMYSTNFDAAWKVTEIRDEENKEELLTLNWTKSTPPAELVQNIGRGYFEWKMGTITTKHEYSTVLFYVIGGNPSWFGGWGIDYVKLVPTSK
jgi:hypothetical protein